jgi:hypothetical protein
MPKLNLNTLFVWFKHQVVRVVFVQAVAHFFGTSSRETTYPRLPVDALVLAVVDHRVTLSVRRRFRNLRADLMNDCDSVTYLMNVNHFSRLASSYV